jgi:hypothetical protein
MPSGMSSISLYHMCTSLPSPFSHTSVEKGQKLIDRYTELIHNHFQHSVLDSLPEWLRKMDDTYGDGLSMGMSFS